eukprot:8032667-Karenia_brevis.AAC.1
MHMPCMQIHGSLSSNFRVVRTHSTSIHKHDKHNIPTHTSVPLTRRVFPVQGAAARIQCLT